MKLTVAELDNYLAKHIQGVFSREDMKVLKEEIEKLQNFEVYLEIGVDEGRSFSVARHYAKDSVFTIGIDIHDVQPHAVSKGRGAFAEAEGMIGVGKRGFFIHGDADEIAELFLDWARPFIKLLFIDGHHDYQSVKKNTESWLRLVRKGGTVLWHDYDHPDVKRYLDGRFGNDKEVLHDKMVRWRKPYGIYR